MAQLEMSPDFYEDLTDWDYLFIDHLQLDTSHLGFLLSFPDDQFYERYKEVEEDDSILVQEAILDCVYNGVEDDFNQEVLVEKTTDFKINYALVSLIKKGLVTYKIENNDKDWKFKSTGEGSEKAEQIRNSISKSGPLDREIQESQGD